jgi:hypothetical protein
MVQRLHAWHTSSGVLLLLPLLLLIQHCIWQRLQVCTEQTSMHSGCWSAAA